MKLRAYIKPNCKHQAMLYDGDKLTLRLVSRAVEGRANQELTKMLADFFGVAKSKITITGGMNSRHKRLEIDAPQAAILKQLQTIKSDPPG